MAEIRFQHDDGGRSAAGFRGETGDCVVRAIAIAGALDYREAYRLVNDAAKRERPRKGRTRSSSRTGVRTPTVRRILADLGWSWTPTMEIGSGCRVHLRADELPTGRLVVNLSKHLAAVIDGTVHDIDPDVARGGTRCVYGYWTAPEEINR